MSRWALGEPDHMRGRLFMAMLLSMRGSICLYQGEELGLDEADLSFEQLVDPYGIRFWPEFKGRDGCRTPMPWHDQDRHGGFSREQPWLPLADRHLPLSVAAQEPNPDSMLNIYRRFVAWRQDQPMLIDGSMHTLHHDEALLVYERCLGDEAWVCLFNLGDSARHFDLGAPVQALDAPSASAIFDGQRVHLPANGFGFARRLA